VPALWPIRSTARKATRSAAAVRGTARDRHSDAVVSGMPSPTPARKRMLVTTAGGDSRVRVARSACVGSMMAFRTIEEVMMSVPMFVANAARPPAAHRRSRRVAVTGSDPVVHIRQRLQSRTGLRLYRAPRTRRGGKRPLRRATCRVTGGRHRLPQALKQQCEQSRGLVVDVDEPVPLRRWRAAAGPVLRRPQVRISDLMKDPHQQLVVVLSISETYACVGGCSYQLSWRSHLKREPRLGAAVHNAILAGCIASRGHRKPTG
jgi:hypothetical protein